MQYIDNYNYMKQQEDNIEDQFEQLVELIKHNQNIDSYQIYKQIRQNIYKQIKINQLAITKILNDLIQIKLHNDKKFDIISTFVANPLLSFQQLSSIFGYTRQRLYQIIAEEAENYIWLKNLLIIKGNEDKKNQNNRSKKIINTKFKTKIRKQLKDKYSQMELF